MFNNIGGKIKVFVLAVTILSVISCVVCGLAVIVFSIFGDNVLVPLSKVGLDAPVLKLAGGFQGALGIVVGLVVMILGSLGAWLLAFIPYGLGQLIQNTDRIAKGIDGIRGTLAKNASHPATPAPGMNVYGNPVYYQPNPYAGGAYPQNPPVNNAPAAQNTAPAAKTPAPASAPAPAVTKDDLDETINVRSVPKTEPEKNVKIFSSSRSNSEKMSPDEIFDAIEGKTAAKNPTDTDNVKKDESFGTPGDLGE